MSRPIQLPLWATDANYPPGSDPWAGSPTKIAPTSGDQAQGWVPNQEPSPEVFNWWKNLVGESISDLYAASLVLHGIAGIPYFPAMDANGGALAWTRIGAAYPNGFGIKATSFVYLYYAFTVPVGRRITGAACAVRGNGSLNFLMNLYTSELDAGSGASSRKWVATKAFVPSINEGVCAIGAADTTPEAGLGNVLPQTINSSTSVLLAAHLDPGISIYRAELRLA